MNANRYAEKHKRFCALKRCNIDVATAMGEWQTSDFQVCCCRSHWLEHEDRLKLMQERLAGGGNGKNPHG